MPEHREQVKKPRRVSLTGGSKSSSVALRKEAKSIIWKQACGHGVCGAVSSYGYYVSHIRLYFLVCLNQAHARLHILEVPEIGPEAAHGSGIRNEQAK